MHIKKSLSLALMAAAGLCVGTTTRPARATSTGDVYVTKVGIWNFTPATTSAAIAIYTSDTTAYKAWISSGLPDCDRSWDVVKAWLSIAQAAKLSGKRVEISFTPKFCGGMTTNMIDTVILKD